MIKNYFKLALRQIWNNKLYSTINIIGLSIGLAACFCILLFVNYQLSYDKHNKKLNDIYLITATLNPGNYKLERCSWDLAGEIKNQYPEILETARFTAFPFALNYDNKKLEIKSCIAADLSIFNIFTLPLVMGNNSDIKNGKDCIILSESAASKYFPESNPMGKTVTFSIMNKTFYLKVAGIMKDIPKSSTFIAEAIIPMKLYEESWNLSTSHMPEQMKKNTQYATTVVLLNNNSDKREFNKKLIDFGIQKGWAQFMSLEAFPYKDIYFHLKDFLGMKNAFSLFPSGEISDIYTYTIVAFLILIMALVNYMLLGIGGGLGRIKEICIRKVTGAAKLDLFIQTTIEAIVTAILALPFSIIFLEYFLPYVSGYLGREIESSYFHNSLFFILIISISIVVGIVAGAYISFYLSRLNPVEIIKNKYARGSSRAVFRRVMISIQLIISIVLIFVITGINNQINYCKTGIKGLDKNNLILFLPHSANIKNNSEVFKDELKKNPSIKNASFIMEPPGSLIGARQEFRVSKLDGSGDQLFTEYLVVDRDFIETMGMKMKSGNSFRNSFNSTENQICIINETAVKLLGDNNPIGKKIMDREIVGIVEDFHNKSFKDAIGPLVLVIDKTFLYQVIIKVDENNIAEALSHLKNTAIKFNNPDVIDYKFYDDYLNLLYGNEDNFLQVIKYAGIIALVIAMLGLFGTSLFLARQRTKEIGIRKTMGASISAIYFLINKEVFVIAAVSTIIAWPIGYYLIITWLNNFAYRINIDIFMFLTAFAATLIMVVLTVSYRTLKAATSNPVESIKSE